MEFTLLSGSYFIQVAYFILWSGLLCAVAALLSKISPHLINWSRFWQAWIVLALIPLWPVTLFQNHGLIPSVLMNAFDAGQNTLISQSKIVINLVSESLISSNLNGVINGVLIIGMMYGAYGFVISLLKLNQLIKRSKPLDINEHCHTAIQTKLTNVRVIEQRISPFVYGFFKPVIVIPQQVFSMPPNQQQLLIEHELTHIKRHDPKSVMIIRLITCLCWFNPFIALMEKRFLQSMELNCDLNVLANNPRQQRDYAQALLTCLKLTNGKQHNGLTAYFSGPKFSKTDFEQRIRNSMSTSAIECYGKGNQLALASLVSLFFTSALLAHPLVLSQDELTPQHGLTPVAKARISSDYDEINAFRNKKPHQGIDFAAPVGTDIIASFSGIVLIADDTSLHRNYGTVILIEHQGETQSLYAHLDSTLVEPGQHIIAGQKIGTVGKTGRVTGSHLHFEMLKNQQRINPRKYLTLLK
jgi:beta-lactamase regulating signal transducer with metallopeptidase domain